ncbi:MAG: hypothetical protein ACO21Q_02250, partial [Burkholderiaceae bacterium]
MEAVALAFAESAGTAALIEAGTVGTAGLAMETAALTATAPTLFTAANMQLAGNAISAFSSFAQ